LNFVLGFGDWASQLIRRRLIKYEHAGELKFPDNLHLARDLAEIMRSSASGTKEK
jgi:hypothetical protein